MLRALLKLTISLVKKLSLHDFTSYHLRFRNNDYKLISVSHFILESSINHNVYLFNKKVINKTPGTTVSKRIPFDAVMTAIHDDWQ